ncbi:hypothetical protein EJ06DRAFT_545709 [Trichodelitschia bisporula]|uniref:Endonuclease III homolog n=1 Tax=Trichodelitschia bisporula TaxID=703511 RepID=A0A6G1IAI4_9PEZI|nr:hypothetical protein EJ06DRAFT_545709 [Trichodelitschia bisporula]
MARLLSFVIAIACCACAVVAQTPPAIFEANPGIGGGGSQFKDSPHFRVYGASDSQADAAIKELEAAYNCLVETIGWRSSGLSYNTASNAGPYYKMNIYGVSSLGSAAGQMFSDARSGMSYLKVLKGSLPDPKVTVHEYGHALTYHERLWVDQTRTGAWWETLAQYIADLYMTSPACEKSRAKFGQKEGRTIVDLIRVIGGSYQVIVDGSAATGNQYQAWPFFAYLTYNPDNYPGLGQTAVRDMIRKYKPKSNDDPLFALARVTTTPVQTIVGRYWARMANGDIGHKQIKEVFMSTRGRLNQANVEGSSGSYKGKAARQPRYMGANIIPLKGSGAITAKITADMAFTATFAVRGQGGATRYVDFENGNGKVSLAPGEEASLVVVNTPKNLIPYDAFKIPTEANRGLSYQVQLTGATASPAMRTSRISRDTTRVASTITTTTRVTRSSTARPAAAPSLKPPPSTSSDDDLSSLHEPSSPSASPPPRKRKRAPPSKLPAVKKSRTSSPPSTPTAPPPHWEEVYKLTQAMRATTIAPVDTMGCAVLADRAAPVEVQRYQTLTSLMLSSQTKDTVTAVAIQTLKSSLPGGLTLESVLATPETRIDELICKVGFHATKAKYIKATAVLLRDRWGGDIPPTIEGLISLPGVGPKMAYLCMSAAWGRDEGVGVDVHVHRITNRWGWHRTRTPEETRKALQAWLPREKWHEINALLVGFGQTVCLPVGPRCGGWVKKERIKKEKVEVVKEEDEDEEVVTGRRTVLRRAVAVKEEKDVKVKTEEELEDIEDIGLGRS